MAVSVVLVGWIAVQVGHIGLGSWLQVAYALFGLVITTLAVSNLAYGLPRGRPGRAGRDLDAPTRAGRRRRGPTGRPGPGYRAGRSM